MIDEWRPAVAKERDNVALIAAANTDQKFEVEMEADPDLHASFPYTWLATWLREWLVRQSIAERSLKVTCAYAVAARASTPTRNAAEKKSGLKVVEFGYGTAPRAPSTWAEIRLDQFLEKFAEVLDTRSLGS